MTGMRMPFQLLPGDGDGDGAHIYLEVAAAVTTFILAGRYFEARAKRGPRCGAAGAAGHGRQGRRPAPAGAGRGHRGSCPGLPAGGRRPVRGPPGEKVATDGIVESGTSAIDASMLTGEPSRSRSVPTTRWSCQRRRPPGRTGRPRRGRHPARPDGPARRRRPVRQGAGPAARRPRSGVFVPIVIVLSLGTLATWLLTGHGATAAFTAAVAVLIIACPCALVSRPRPPSWSAPAAAPRSAC